MNLPAPALPTQPQSLSQRLPAKVSDFHAITDVDARLAVEIALRLRTTQELLDTYNLTPQALKAKINNPQFRAQVKQARTLWNSDLSVKERIRLKTQLLVEDSLLPLFGMVHNDNLAPAARTEAFKTLAKVADVDSSDKQQADIGARFTVSINLGQGQPPLVIDAPAASRSLSHED